MHNESLQKPEHPRQTPWNKGKLIGSKPPLRTKDVWSIRTKLQVEKRPRDLPSKLRSEVPGRSGPTLPICLGPRGAKSGSRRNQIRGIDSSTRRAK
jgi:hypothetical protein